MKDLSNYRKSYDKSELLENQIPEDPINLFHKWFFEAEDLNAADEVNAMTISTIGLDGYPKSRVVLLKNFNEEGFVFYTNYNSEKGKAILNNPNVCLSFFGQQLNVKLLLKVLQKKQRMSFLILILLLDQMVVNLEQLYHPKVRLFLIELF